jgi:hypothetical protein
VKSCISDTNPKIEKKLIRSVRQKSIAEKLSQAASLSSLSRQLSKRAIARRNREMSKKEINYLFVRYHYGEDLYQRLTKESNSHGKK